ncbi:MAG: Holliday junction resolvase RuvX [Chloroflexi bacterium]|nr:Holliday junction resolvase RuvX [Chloroflexota bacterium]
MTGRVLSSPFLLPAGRLLALDLGQARIGVAACDELAMLATPLTVVRRRATRAEDFTALAALVAAEKAVGVLIGLPLDSAGQEGPQARWARRYGSRLASAVPAPVAFWDESDSTVDAADLVRGGRGRTSLDAAAAAVFLQSFLEARRSRVSREAACGGEDS